MKNNNQRTYLPIFCSSTIAAIISTFITNPLEVAKANLQYYPLSCPQYPHQNYTELIRCQCSKFSFEGAWRSLKIAIPQNIFCTILWMQIYEKVRNQCLKNNILNSSNATLFSAIMARLIVTTSTIPLQLQKIKISNSIPISIFTPSQGLKITLMRDLIFSAIFWSLIQNTRNAFMKQDYRQCLNTNNSYDIFWLNFTIGAIYGGISSAITTPLDTLKTRIQSTGMKKYSIWKQMMKIYKIQGYMGLLSGIHYRVMKSSLHSTLYISVYEWVIHKFNKKIQ